MSRKITPRCPSCSNKLDHVLLTYELLSSFSLENIEDDELNWEDCIGERDLDAMRFYCPICGIHICEFNPDAMIAFLSGKKVRFIKESNYFDCTEDRRRK